MPLEPMTDAEFDDFCENVVLLLRADSGTEVENTLLANLPGSIASSVEEVIAIMSDYSQRMVVVTGPAKSGKTFFIKAILDYLRMGVGYPYAPMVYEISEEFRESADRMTVEQFRRFARDLASSCGRTPDDLLFYSHSLKFSNTILLSGVSCGMLLEATESEVLDIKEGNLYHLPLWDRGVTYIDSSSILVKYEELKDYFSSDFFLMYAYRNLPHLHAIFDDNPESFSAFMRLGLLALLEGIAEGGHKGNSEYSPYPIASFVSFVSECMISAQIHANKMLRLDKLSRDEIDYRAILESCIERNLGAFVSLYYDRSDDATDSFIRSLMGEDSETEEQQVEVTEIEYGDMTTLSERLSSRVFGQEEAVSAIVDNLLLAASGLRPPAKPRAVILCAGKTGTGKTELVLSLADNISTKELPVVRVDMSEYSESHESAKLLGAPPGYSGHDKGGVLTNAVKKTPQCVILLDEIEKAHPKIWDMFLQVFDAGRLTDGNGMTVDFSQTVIIMTTNLGVSEMVKKKAGFATARTSEESNKENQNKVKAALEKFFRLELLNRIDDVVVFNDITEDIATMIIRREFDVLSERMSGKKYQLNPISDDIVRVILEKSNIEMYGAREIQRVFSRTISLPVARFITSKPERIRAGKIDLSLDRHNQVIVSSARRSTKRK